MTTLEQTALIEKVRAGYAERIETLEALLATGDLGGFVHCWANYGLGVKIGDGKVGTVAIEDATVVGAKDKRTFQNGGREPAVLMRRRAALENALRTTRAAVEQFERAVRPVPEVAGHVPGGFVI